MPHVEHRHICSLLFLRFPLVWFVAVASRCPCLLFRGMTGVPQCGVVQRIVCLFNVFYVRCARIDGRVMFCVRCCLVR